MDEELKLDNGLPEEGPTKVVEKPPVDKWVPPEIKRFRDSRGVIYVKNQDGSLRREVPEEKKPKAEKKQEARERFRPRT